MPEESLRDGSEELVGFAAGLRRPVELRSGPGTQATVTNPVARARKLTSGTDSPTDAPEPLDAPPDPESPAVTAITADLERLEDTVSNSVASWLELWQRIDSLCATAPAGSSAAQAGEALRTRTLAATTTIFKVSRFPEVVAASRQLVSAASAVFNGQPDAKAWPSRIGRVINANVVAADYETIAGAMREYAVKIAALDEAIKNARDQEVLWLLPEGSLRCPAGAAEILRSEAAAANLITGADDLPGSTRLLGALAMFSTPGRSQETLTSLAAPFRLEVIEIAREAHSQLKILHREGAAGGAEAALSARPFRLRGVELREDASVTYVLMVALWIGSGAILAVLARSVPQYVLLPSGLAMLALSTIAAMQPARGAKRDAWDSAVEAASQAVQVLQEVLQVRKKPAASSKKDDRENAPARVTAT